MASRQSVAPDSREVRLSARAIKILSKNERLGQGREGRREGGKERASERASERRHQRTERNLKGHPAIHLSMQPLTRRLFVRRDRTNPSGNHDSPLPIPLLQLTSFAGSTIITKSQYYFVQYYLKRKSSQTHVHWYLIFRSLTKYDLLILLIKF